MISSLKSKILGMLTPDTAASIVRAVRPFKQGDSKTTGVDKEASDLCDEVIQCVMADPAMTKACLFDL